MRKNQILYTNNQTLSLEMSPSQNNWYDSNYMTIAYIFAGIVGTFVLKSLAHIFTTWLGQLGISQSESINNTDIEHKGENQVVHGTEKLNTENISNHEESEQVCKIITMGNSLNNINLHQFEVIIENTNVNSEHINETTEHTHF